jgi:hypothetical protein
MKSAFILSLASVMAWGDISYTSTTQVTGGALVQMASIPIVGGKIKEALQPQTTQTFLKGDRLATKSGDSASIIDLAAETITQVDLKSRTYSVMTFAEFEAQLEKAMSEMNRRKAERKDQSAEMKFDVDVKETGRTATIDGLPCREVVLTTTATATDPQTGQAGEFRLDNIMWLAKEVPGQAEMNDFWMRMAAKMKFDPKGPRMDAMPGFGPGLAELQKKARLLEGTPIVSTIVAGPSEAARPEEVLPETTDAIRRGDQATIDRIQTQGPSGKQVAGDAAVSAIGSAIPGLGGLGGFGRKKKQEPPREAPSATPDAAIMMKMRVTEYGFSTGPVDAAQFAIPEGFKKTSAK